MTITKHGELVQKRIDTLVNDLAIKISHMKTGYKDLSDEEKHPLRIMQAEIMALKMFMDGDSLDEAIEWCVEDESFEGAAGIKKAKYWIENNK